MSILTNKNKFMNDKLIDFSKVDSNYYEVCLKNDIEQFEYESFGLHIVPNILFKLFGSLNDFKFVLEFQYEFSTADDIRIYNGIEWTTYKINKSNGLFKDELQFEFKKNY